MVPSIFIEQNFEIFPHPHPRPRYSPTYEPIHSKTDLVTYIMMKHKLYWFLLQHSQSKLTQ